MSVPAKGKATLPTKGDSRPMVVDARFIRELKADADVQYLVIPVKNMSGGKVQSLLTDERHLEEKIQAFLASVGLEDAFVRTNEQKRGTTSDSENNDEFDLFDGLNELRAENNRRVENLREYILADAKWLDASSLSEHAGFENKNRSAGPNTWKRRNKIFAISYKGKNLYPRYCLDEAYQPLGVIKEILTIFDNSKSGWSLAFWFGTGNSWLGGAKPKDMLTGDKSKLLRAAQAAKEGIQHG